MKKKYTYKPTSSVKYGKGGKNKKKSYKSDGKHYKAQYGLISPIVNPLVNLFGIDTMETYLTDLRDDAILQQEQAGITGYDMVTDPLGLGQLTPEASATLTEYRDQIGISRPKKTSTEFLEGVKDTIGQQTTGVLSDIGRTGKMTGIKDVLGSTDQALIQAQEKAAGMDERYQQQLTDIEKFETGQETQIVSQLGQQEFASDQTVYDLAGDLAAQSAAAGGDLEASAIAGLVDLQGQEIAAWSDFISAGIDTVIALIDPFEKGGKVPKIKAEKGAKMQEYEEGAKQNMIPAEEADVTPGKFSHEDNPIDIVQDGEKIGEMTGGEAIVPPKDVAEFEDLLAEGDKDAVFNKLKGLFAKWEQAAQEHKEKNLDQAAMGGAKMHYKPKSKINYR